MTFYVGIAETGAGQQVLAVSNFVDQIGGPPAALDLLTHEDRPTETVGDTLFRSIDVAGRSVNGANLGITPIVDGASQPEQSFEYLGGGDFQAQAMVAVRGTSIAARVRSLSRTDAIEIIDVSYSFVPLRNAP